MQVRFVAVLVAVAGLAWGQANVGEISGQVSDATGANRTASLSWLAPASGTVSNYMVLPTGTTRFQILGAAATTATLSTAQTSRAIRAAAPASRATCPTTKPGAGSASASGPTS